IKSYFFKTLEYRSSKTSFCKADFLSSNISFFFLFNSNNVRTLLLLWLSILTALSHFFNKICIIIITWNSVRVITMIYSPYIYVILIILLISTSMDNNPIQAEETNMYEERLSLYKKTEAISDVPWYYLAAMDQYERNKQLKSPDEESLISIRFPDELWYGIGNPNNQTISIVQSFNGIGQDGNGNGKANPENDEDTLLAVARLLVADGLTKDDIRINLWNYYKRDLSVKSIMDTAKVLEYYGTNELTDRSFPVDTDYNFSYQSNWGD